MNASIENSDESGEVEVFEPTTSEETDINTEDLTAGENVDENEPKDNVEQNSEENEAEVVPEETSNDLGKQRKCIRITKLIFKRKVK